MKRSLIIIPGFAISGGAADTVIHIRAATGKTIFLAGFCIWGNGADPSKAQGKIELCRQTADGTGATAITSSSEPLQGNVALDPASVIIPAEFTTEPTTVTPIKSYPIHPAGLTERNWSLQQEMIESAISGALGIRITPLANLTINGWVEFLE